MISASLRIPATIFESFLSQLGRVVLQFHQAYTSNDMIVKILDAMDCIKTAEKAQQDKLDASTTEGIELWSKAMEEKGMSLEEIDDRVYEAKYAIEKMDAVYDFLKDPDILDVDVQIEADSYTSTNAMNKFKMMYQLAEKRNNYKSTKFVLLKQRKIIHIIIIKLYIFQSFRKRYLDAEI